MPDQIKPQGKTQPSEDERRNAAAKESAQNQVENRGTQVHIVAPNQPAKPKEPARGAGPEESFEHAGRAVRAQPATRQDPATQRKSDIDEDTVEFRSESDETAPKSDEDADPSDASSPIDERIERKTRAQQTADEEQD